MSSEVIDLIYQKVMGIAQPGDFAVSDFDNTCIYNDIGEAVFHYLCANGLLRNDSMLGQRGRRLGKAEYHQKVFNRYYRIVDNVRDASLFAYAALAGFSPIEIERIFNETLEYEGEEPGYTELFGKEVRKGIKVREEMRELISRLQKPGIPTTVVTASAQILVELMLEKYFSGFGCNCGCIGITSEHETNGALTDRIILPITALEGKVEAIKVKVDPERTPVLGSGDSPNDAHMLRYSRIKVVVGRNLQLLESIIDESGEDWFFL